jgi:hypothetical protein
MRSLKEWPGAWIAAAWVLWPAAIALVGSAALAFIVGAAQDRAGAVGVHLSIHVEPPSIVPLIATAFGPPLVLTAAWLGWRHGRRTQPPA